MGEIRIEGSFELLGQFDCQHIGPALSIHIGVVIREQSLVS